MSGERFFLRGSEKGNEGLIGFEVCGSLSSQAKVASDSGKQLVGLVGLLGSLAEPQVV
jgi:hypothetical protein